MTARTKLRTDPVSRAEYEALLARLEDVEDALRMRAVEARGTTPDAMPSELAKRMLAGEHPVRIWREHRGLTRAELAERAEIPPGYLSEIENGRKPGSTAAYQRLANALGVAVDDILPTPVEESADLRFIDQPGAYNSARETVRFYATYGGQNVAFAITYEALVNWFGLKSGAEAEVLRVFERNRPEIETLASRLHEQGARRRDGFLVIDTKVLHDMRI
jgi:transcriptional regulator with XRE-family HTH domain